MTGQADAADHFASQDLLASLTLKEKAELCSGQNFWQTRAIPRVDLPAILLTDGPHGVRKQAGALDRVDIRGVPATCFPTAAALANAWDRELLYAVGRALGEECREQGVAVLLGPGVNIKRSPLCGRNFEYFSEDPLLAGELAAQWIRGVQEQGVGTSLKHFAANNQEHRRMVIDAHVDQRALREIYLLPFEIAVKQAQPWTVMAAYNRLNGVYCSENAWLLNQVLREEWGFRGIVVSDWGACNDRVAGLRAGLDLEMPSSSGLNTARLVRAVRSGSLEIAELDRTVQRLQALIAKAVQGHRTDFRYDRAAHHDLARRAAAESAVLLKNEGSLLPLAPQTRLALIGDFAQRPRYQGTGSSQINPHRIDTASDALAALGIPHEFAAGYRRDDERPDSALIDAACEAARCADVAVVFAGLPETSESEGFDRTHLHMPKAHTVLIERVAQANPRIVVVLSGGAPVETSWRAAVPSILAAYLGGQASGSAIVDVLWGRVNPSGKLAETWPFELRDTPAYHYFPGGPRTVEYRESLYVGYRYYDSAHKPVAFPSGHGLSYTQFAYTDLRISQGQLDADTPLKVTLRIRNIGAVAGAEVVQLYVRERCPRLFRPDKELKHFTKLQLAIGEEQSIAFELTRRAFAHFDPDRGDWVVGAGEFDVLVGASSADIRALATVFVRGETTDQPMPAAVVEYGQLHNAEFQISDAAFATIRPPIAAQARQAEAFDINSLLGEVRRTRIGRLLCNVTLANTRKMAGQMDDPTLGKMFERVVAEMPLRQLVAFSGGRLTFELMEALVAFMNGRYWVGFKLLCNRPSS